jgi:hypothetical protein
MTGMKAALLVLWLLWMVVVAALLMVCQLLLLMMVIVKATCLLLTEKSSLILFVFAEIFRKNRLICRKIAPSVAKIHKHFGHCKDKGTPPPSCPCQHIKKYQQKYHVAFFYTKKLVKIYSSLT